MTDVGKPEHLPGPAVSRRRFLGRGATAGAAIAGGTLWVGASAVRGGKASSDSPIRHIVLVKVERAIPLISPAYDQDRTEDEIRDTWLRYWEALYHHKDAE